MCTAVQGVQKGNSQAAKAEYGKCQICPCMLTYATQIIVSLLHWPACRHDRAIYGY